MREVKSGHFERWVVTYSALEMNIGCESHEIEKWWAFTDDEIKKMAPNELEWWRKWKPVLKQIIEISPAVPTGKEEK